MIFMGASGTQAAMMACMERMHRIRFWHSPNGMSPGECKLLSIICRLEQENGSAAVSELAKMTGMKSASISRIMNTLEQKDLIERSIDPNRRRNVLVSSTARGKETDSEQQKAMCHFWNAVFARVPEGDVTELLRIWNEIMDSMEAVVQEQTVEEEDVD